MVRLDVGEVAGEAPERHTIWVEEEFLDVETMLANGHTVLVKSVINPITLLLSRFPELPQWAGEELDPDKPYYAYARFAEQVQTRLDDPQMLGAACRFIDELAETGDRELRDILIDVFESLADNPEVVSRIRPRIRPAARSLLQDVERDFSR